MGGMLIIYTVTGGARAVAHTQKLQLTIILIGMAIAGYLVVRFMPSSVGFLDALHLGGKNGKMNVITSGVTENGFDWKDKYNIWSGVIGGFFLALSYFGTDQSQVGRYLTAQNNRQGRLGLLLNGIVKVPMQFLILMLGVLVFSFYQFNKAPIHFNETQSERAKQTSFKNELTSLETTYAGIGITDNVQKTAVRDEYRAVLKKALPGEDVNDTNFIFLRFVIDYLPQGLVGLLIAVIFLAAWGSIAAALNSLASCTVVDIHKKFFKKELTQKEDYRISQLYTLCWGIFCILVAEFASNLGNSLIETVNILGSLFYGVILGIFLVAFWFKYIKANALFYAAIITEIFVIAIYKADVISFLWLNAIGAILVIVIGFLIQPFWSQSPKNEIR
jgi:Na+/proline symporter